MRLRALDAIELTIHETTQNFVFYFKQHVGEVFRPLAGKAPPLEAILEQ